MLTISPCYDHTDTPVSTRAGAPQYQAPTWCYKSCCLESDPDQPAGALQAVDHEYGTAGRSQHGRSAQNHQLLPALLNGALVFRTRPRTGSEIWLIAYGPSRVSLIEQQWLEIDVLSSFEAKTLLATSRHTMRRCKHLSRKVLLCPADRDISSFCEAALHSQSKHSTGVSASHTYAQSAQSMTPPARCLMRPCTSAASSAAGLHTPHVLPPLTKSSHQTPLKAMLCTLQLHLKRSRSRPWASCSSADTCSPRLSAPTSAHTLAANAS